MEGTEKAAFAGDYRRTMRPTLCLQEAPHFISDNVAMGLQRKMSGIQNMHVYIFEITFVRISTGWWKYFVILSPFY